MKTVTYRGFKTVVVYDEETAYGTGATPATAIKGKISTISTTKNNTLIRTQGLGEGRNETFVGFGNFEGTWSMEYEVASFDLLQFGIGSLHGIGTPITPYYLQEEDFMDYTAGADSGLKSFAFDINSLDVTGGTHNKDTLSGMIINTIGLSLNLGETLKCSLDGFYRTVTSATSTTAYTADTTKPWTFAQGNFLWDTTTPTSADNVNRVTSCSININNNFAAEVGRQIGSRFTEAAEPGLRKYDWVLTVKMTDVIATKFRDIFYGQANTPTTGIADAEPTFYKIILNLSEGNGSGERNAQILLDDCAISDISKPINIGDNIVELTINGTSKKGTTETSNRPIKYWTVPA